MFGLKGMLITGGIGAAAVAVVTVLWQLEKADRKTAEAEVVKAAAVIAGYESQVKSLQQVAVDRQFRLDQANALAAANDQINTDLSADVAALNNTLSGTRKELRDAESDADAVLSIAGSLCGTEQRVEALRARYNHQGEASRGPDPEGPAHYPCSAPVEKTLRSVGDYALRIGAAYEQAAIQIGKVIDSQAEAIRIYGPPSPGMPPPSPGG